MADGPDTRRDGDGQARGKGLSHAGTTGFGLGVPASPQRFDPSVPLVSRPPDRAAGSNAWLRPTRLVLLGIVLFVVVAVLTAGAASGWNAPGYHASGDFLNTYTGVFALVALSISVMIGLAASDQLVLAPRQRVLAQAIHRAAAFTAVAMLFVHVVCKLVSDKLVKGDIRLVDAVIPFTAQHRAAALGLGVVAAYMMIAVCVTGIIRSRFATGHRPGIWRAVHALAYVSWPFAIIHGLTSGRPPMGSWVTLSYVLCVLAVVLALPTRLITRGRAGRRS